MCRLMKRRAAVPVLPINRDASLLDQVLHDVEDTLTGGVVEQSPPALVDDALCEVALCVVRSRELRLTRLLTSRYSHTRCAVSFGSRA